MGKWESLSDLDGMRHQHADHRFIRLEDEGDRGPDRLEFRPRPDRPGPCRDRLAWPRARPAWGGWPPPLVALSAASGQQPFIQRGARPPLVEVLWMWGGRRRGEAGHEAQRRGIPRGRPR